MKHAWFVRNALTALLAAAFAVATPATAQAPRLTEKANQLDAYVTTGAYLVTFYPLWFTWYQSQVASVNRIVGPDRVTSIYQIVVAINVDTLYASTFVDVAQNPLVISVPAMTGAYSVLVLDPYGTVHDVGIPSQSPGSTVPATTYVLYGRSFKGSLPQGVTPIALPLDHMQLIFRADRYSPSGVNQESIANTFRASLKTQPLCAYQGVACPPNTPPGGDALILPEIAFSPPFKTVADMLVATDAISFLQQLQVAVKAPNTPPLTADEKVLSDRFDRFFGDGNISPEDQPLFVAAAQAGHELIVERYHANKGPTEWIHFGNIGAWGDRVIDRASITEFIQYGNDIRTAAYYHTFNDGGGRPLNGRNSSYVLTFSKSEIPQASRFWSVTVYTPEAIQLVLNPQHKYATASYTPGLRYEADGSVRIHLSPQKPFAVPEANWIPIPQRAFNVMLRVYGPEGSVSANTYVPPAIQPMARLPR